MITLDGRTILVADDELGFRELIGDELALAGADPIAVESGDLVAPVLARQKIEAVITDIRMPRVDGLTLLDSLKKQNPNFPVFMMTGFSDAQIEDIYDRGADGLYTKPCDMDEVIQDIHRALLPPAERFRQHFAKHESAISYLAEVRGVSDLQGSDIHLGRGGLFLKANGRLPRVQSEIHFAIQILNRQIEFKGVGICRWSKHVEGVGDAFGLQFVSLESAANALYLKLMEQSMPIASIPKGPGGLK
jgi:CheY-like chemotaxis protein